MADYEDEEVYDLSKPEVVTKVKAASEIANKAIAKVVSELKAGLKIVALCTASDAFINAEVSKVFSKLKEKGVAFPTAISVNNTVGNFSPLSDDATLLKLNDVCKVDLGVHIDGFIAVCSQTVVLSEPGKEITGKVADVIAAARTACEACCKSMRPGKTNAEISDIIQRVAAEYHVTPVEGVLSHMMSRYVIDGNKVIMNKPTPDQRVEEAQIEDNEMWAIDVVMSTGEGKPKEQEARTTIFKRTVDQQYLLKMKASRYVLNEVNNKFPTFPFTLRALDEKRAKLGITEMVNHSLVDPYPVLFEKAGETVAHFKATVLVLPKQTQIATEIPALPATIKSTVVIQDPKITAIFAEKKPEPKAAAPAPAAAAPAAAAAAPKAK